MYDFAEYKSLFEKNKWEFSYYLMHKKDPNVILPSIELKAKLEFDLLDKNILQEYFLKVIEDYEKLTSMESEKYYSNKMTQIKRKYRGSDFLSLEIRNLHKNIFDKVYADSSIYITSRKKVIDAGINIDINRKISQYSVEQIESLPFATSKLINISNYKSETEYSMLYQKLYRRYVENRFDTLQDLFRDEKEFNAIISLLLKNGDIDILDSGYRWKIVDDGEKLTVKTLICVFSLIIAQKKYYKINPTDVQVVNLLNSYFYGSMTENDSISYKYYGKVRIKFQQNKNENLQRYIGHFCFIPNSKNK